MQISISVKTGWDLNNFLLFLLLWLISQVSRLCALGASAGIAAVQRALKLRCQGVSGISYVQRSLENRSKT